MSRPATLRCIVRDCRTGATSEVLAHLQRTRLTSFYAVLVPYPAGHYLNGRVQIEIENRPALARMELAFTHH